MSDVKRLEQVLESYGADPERWPADDRSGLESLLAESPDARALRDAAARLDSILDTAGEIPTPPPQLAARILQGAPGRKAPVRRGWWAAVVPLAAAAALALYVNWVEEIQSAAPSTAPQTESFEIALVDLGIYTTPTDVLLSIEGVDPLARVPPFECEESALGCLELEPDETERQTSRGGPRRMTT